MKQGWYILLAVTLTGYNGETMEVDLEKKFPMFHRTESRNPNIDNPLAKQSCKDRWIKYFNEVEQRSASQYPIVVKPTHWIDARFKYKYVE